MSVIVKNITVSFPGIKALDDVSVEFRPGRIHGVLGANGSGKSTLVKVLTGIYHPDADCGAVIQFGDKRLKDVADPQVSRDIGVRVVHQESPLIPNMTVEESIALFKGYSRKKSGMIDWRTVHNEACALLRDFELDYIDPTAKVNTLTAAERNLMAIAIAIGKDDEAATAKLLILDEADASIPESETELYLEHVRKIAQKGIPIMMVTHRMKQARNVCDDLTVLNDGHIVLSGLMSDHDDNTLIRSMMRADQTDVDNANTRIDKRRLAGVWKQLGFSHRNKANENVLSMRDIRTVSLKGLDLDVRAGEIVGVIGLSDSGIRDIPKLFMGDLQRAGGQVSLCGEPLPQRLEPRTLIKKGICVMPTDRFRQGGIMSYTLLENMRLPDETKFWKMGQSGKRALTDVIDLFDVRPRTLSLGFGKFSGGNQQKAIIAKWLQFCPRFMLLDDPTYGVDPAARLTIFASMKEAAKENIGFLVFSTEPEQLAGVCTRVLVIREGKVECELKTEEHTLTRENIARWCYT